jgi:hypothetical protein
MLRSREKSWAQGGKAEQQLGSPDGEPAHRESWAPWLLAGAGARPATEGGRPWRRRGKDEGGAGWKNGGQGKSSAGISGRHGGEQRRHAMAGRCLSIEFLRRERDGVGEGMG